MITRRSFRLLTALALAFAVAPTAPVHAQFGVFGQEGDDAAVERGQEMFEAVCTACHTVDPPHGKAPPMRHVANRLKRVTEGSFPAFANHVVEFARNPSAETAVMPPHVIERFGVMPPLGLDEERLRDVAAYLWSLTREGAPDHRPGRGSRGG